MTAGRPIIEAEQLTKAYGLMPVLRRLDLQVERGTCVALLGPNGSGKSTLLRLISGLSRPTAGVLRVGGWLLPREAAAVRGYIGVVSHRALLYEGLTARENLLFFARLYAIPDADARISSLLTQVGLHKRAHDLVRTFSRGMLQRLSIARSILHNPDILLLDEPHTGLDQHATAALDALIATARAEGRTILLTTHHLDKAVQLAERILILSRGVIAYDQTTAGLTEHDLTEAYTRVTGSAPLSGEAALETPEHR